VNEEIARNLEYRSRRLQTLEYENISLKQENGRLKGTLKELISICDDYNVPFGDLPRLVVDCIERGDVE